MDGSGKMNPDVKAIWLEALESGRYEKGRHHLRNTDGTYCCLGVLCDLMNQDDWKFDRESMAWLYGKSDAFQFLPPSVKDWAGGFGYPQTSACDHQGSLAEMNDESDTFAPVIAYIKAHL